MSESEQTEQSEGEHTEQRGSAASENPSPPPRRISERQYAAFSALLKSSHAAQSRTLGQKLGRPLNDSETSEDDEDLSEDESVAAKTAGGKRDAELSDLWPLQPTDLPDNGASFEEAIRLFAFAHVRANRLSFASRDGHEETEEDDDPLIPPDLVASVTSTVNEMLVFLATARPARTGKKRKALGPMHVQNVLSLAACVSGYTQHVSGISRRLASALGDAVGAEEPHTAATTTSVPTISSLLDHRLRLVQQAKERIADKEDLYDSEIVPPADEKRAHQSAKERAARSERRLAKRQKREQAG